MTGVTLTLAAAAYAAGASIPALFRANYDYVFTVCVHVAAFAAILGFLWL
ncbi:hypothetical protein ACFOHJ_11505 [Aquamicrobium soli]|uniref:Uncharacterized protein n=1 Tax=Aquamicrobium soli TaxID=1811518 RepID=A0ABV7K9Q4_9HYPH